MTAMKHIISIFLAAWMLVGCSTLGPSSAQDASATSKVLFRGQEHVLIWIEGAPSMGMAIASTVIGSMGLESSTVARIHQAISPADSTPVRVAVSGEDSRFVAKAILAALDQVQGDLPKLTLAYVGNPADAGDIRAAVEAKGGTFLFAPS